MKSIFQTARKFIFPERILIKAAPKVLKIIKPRRIIHKKAIIILSIKNKLVRQMANIKEIT